jgi:hypothetical protein
MTRSRAENRKAHTLGIHDVSISEQERLFISWLVGSIEGLDKQGSQVVARLIEEFDLENLDTVDQSKIKDEKDYVLSGYELKFLREYLDKSFRDRKIKPMYAIASTKLDDRITKALDGAAIGEDEPEEEEVGIPGK